MVKMTHRCHCLLYIQSENIECILDYLLTTESTLFKDYYVKSCNKKEDNIVIEFSIPWIIDNKSILTFLNHKSLRVTFANLWFECKPMFGKIKYTPEKNKIISKLHHKKIDIK